MAAKPDVWLCGKTLYTEQSAVIPGHSVFQSQDFHPISKTRREPPEWCERPLEQAITAADEDVDIDADKPLVYDGNNTAKFYAESTGERRMSSWAKLNCPPPLKVCS